MSKQTKHNGKKKKLTRQEEKEKLEKWKNFEDWDEFYDQYIIIIIMNIIKAFDIYGVHYTQYDIEDVCSEVFLRLIEKDVLQPFDPDRMRLHNYLALITYRITVNWIKKEGNSPTNAILPNNAAPLIDPGTDSDPDSDPDSGPDSGLNITSACYDDIKELMDIIISILQSYPELLKSKKLIQVFYLRYLIDKKSIDKDLKLIEDFEVDVKSFPNKGLDVESIAKKLNMSIGAVQTALSRIKKILREHKEILV